MGTGQSSLEKCGREGVKQSQTSGGQADPKKLLGMSRPGLKVDGAWNEYKIAYSRHVPSEIIGFSLRAGLARKMTCQDAPGRIAARGVMVLYPPEDRVFGSCDLPRGCFPFESSKQLGHLPVASDSAEALLRLH